MNAPTYLVKNNLQIYYFRFVIPEEFRHRFPNYKREICKSLKTRNRRIALDEARKLRVQISRMMNMDEIDGMDLEIEELDSGLNLLEKLNRVSHLSKEQGNQNILDEFFYNLSSTGTKQLNTAISHKEGLEQDNLSGESQNSVTNAVEGEIPLQEQLKQISDTSIQESNNEDKEESIRLNDVVEFFLRDKKVNVTNQKTIDTYERNCSLLVRVIGNKISDDINAKDIRKFKDTLIRLPKNINHSLLYKNKSIAKILELDIPLSDRFT